MKQETAVDFLKKIKSIKLCLMAHPDNKINSEFADRISDLEDIEFELEKQQQGYSEEEVLDIVHKCGKYCYDSKKIGTDIGLMPNLLIGFFEQFKKK